MRYLSCRTHVAAPLHSLLLSRSYRRYQLWRLFGTHHASSRTREGMATKAGEGKCSDKASGDGQAKEGDK